MKGDDVTKLPTTLDDEAWQRASLQRLVADEPWPDPPAVETLQPDDEGRVMFPPEVVDRIAEMDQAIARLRKLGQRHVDYGRCEHGFVAGVRVQEGRAAREVSVHGSSPADALNKLADQLETMPRAKRRRKGKR